MSTICFDLRALQVGHQHRGIGMYVRSVLEHLVPDGNTYLVYCFDSGDPIVDLGIETQIQYEVVSTRALATAPNSLRDVPDTYRVMHHGFPALQRRRPDTFVQFDFTLGVPAWPGVRTVVIGYDLIPLIMKNEYLPSPWFAFSHSPHRVRGALRALYHRYRYRIFYATYRTADVIVCISEATARSFHRLLDIPHERLRVVPLAPVLARDESDGPVQDLISKPYVFYLGGVDHRKRVEDIVRAFDIARGRGAHLALVLAGQEFRSIDELPDGPLKRSLRESPYRDDIIMLGFVSDNEKLRLYRRAHAFVFTSIYEGFGLPVVEAMAAGCPVIAYDNSSIGEAAGDAGLLVETGDYVAVARRLLELEDPTLRAELIDRGKRQAATFGWDKHVAEFQEILQ